MMIIPSMVFALLLGPPGQTEETEETEETGQVEQPEESAPADPGPEEPDSPNLRDLEQFGQDLEKQFEHQLEYLEREADLREARDELDRTEQDFKENHVVPAAGVDPLQSALATIPDVPVLDVLSTSVEVSSKDAFAKLTIAPFALIPWHERIVQPKDTGLSMLPELRFNISGDTDKGTFGFGGSWGYSSMAHRLWVGGFDSFVDKCMKDAFDEKNRNTLESRARQLAEFVTKNGGDVKDPDDRGTIRSAWKELRERLTAEKRDKGDKLYTALAELESEALDKRAKCIGDKLYRERMDDAYKNAFGGYVEAGTTLFAVVDGPSLQDSPTCTATLTTDCVQPGEETFSPVAPNRMQSIKISAAFSYFASMRFGIWLTGSYERMRAKPSDDDMAEIVSAGFTFAGLVAQGKVGKDGYIPGLGLGASYQRSWCLERETSDPTDMDALVACKRTLLFYSDPGSMSYVDRIAPFFDVRVSSKLQARITLPVERVRLREALDNSDGGRTVFQFIPSISLGVASWGVHARG